MLIASAAGLPLLLTTASGCSSADFFIGQDPLAGPAPLAHSTVMLEEAIATENQLISRYTSALDTSALGEPALGGSAGRPAVGSLLATLLAEHRAHLDQLRARLVIPAGMSRSPTASPATTPQAGTPHSLSALRAAERQSADSLLVRLGTVEPALAQLFASIAASDATHVAALSALGVS
jgi:hypothetical protein